MRPLYETQQHIDVETEFGVAIQHALGFRFHKLPISYRLEHIIFNKNKRFIGFSEIKCRSHNYGDFPTIFISLHKWLAAMEAVTGTHPMSLAGTSKFLLFIRYANGEGYCYLHKPEKMDGITIEYGGRTRNTRDSADVEPVVHISIDRLTKIL